MASAVQGLRFTARSCQCRFATRSNTYRSIGRRRHFATTSIRNEEGPTEPKVESTPAPATSAAFKPSLEFVNKLDPHERAIYDSLSDIEKSQYEADARTLEAHFAKPEVMQRMHNVMASALAQAGQMGPSFREPRMGKYKAGFFAQGEELSEEVGEDPEFQEDDISSLAHGDLEQHRELREYARLAAWEMPLLAKMSKPFEPPTLNEPLRFRYTTYMGEQHPAEKKVVVEFCPADMPNLTDLQKDKLRKLSGPRWNPEKDLIKMSSEMFQTQAQNKRYLGDLVDNLLKEARDPTDTFEDVPFDTRHHTFKVKPKFPKEWRLSPERVAELRAIREQTALAQQQSLIDGSVINGVRQISAAFGKGGSMVPKEKVAIPELANAGKGAKGGKKVGVRR